MDMLGLHKRKLKPLVYGEVVRKDLKLLEVDDDMLREIEKGSVVIKGDPSSEAVLCTDSTTYALRLVETTNSLLLAPALEVTQILNRSLVRSSETMVEQVLTSQRAHQDFADRASPQGTSPHHATFPGLAALVLRNVGVLQCKEADMRQHIAVLATADSHLELIRAAPDFSKLDEMLQERIYNGGEACSSDAEDIMDFDSPKGRNYTFDQLLEGCQASRQEVEAALQERHAVEMDSRWHLVDPDFLGILLQVCVLTAQEEGWPLDQIPQDEAMDAIVNATYDARVVRSCFKQYGRECKAGMFSLDETKVCVYWAEKLLASKPRWVLTEFLSEWSRAVPEGMEPQEEMLAGLVLGEVSGGEQVVSHFPAAALSVDPAQRFAQLFAARGCWVMKDLQPFLQGLQAPGQSAEALLLKYCRSSQMTPEADVELTSRY